MKEHDSLYPKWEMDTIWTRFTKSVTRFGASPYLITEGKTYSYAYVKCFADALARSLYALGVRPGDHVAVIMRNCPEWVFLTYALAKLGATKVPVNTEIGRDELIHVLTSSEVEFLVSMYALDEVLLSKLPKVEKIVLSNNNILHQGRGFLLWNEFLKLGETVEERVVKALSEESQDPFGLSDIIFTAGSTASPKGVTLTHDMLLRSAYGVSYTRCFEKGRRVYLQFPLFHIYSYAEGLLAALFMGCALILTTGGKDVDAHLKMIQDYHANDVMSLAPQMVRFLSEGNPSPEDYPDLHSLYFGLFTPEWIWEAARDKFGVEDICTGTGMTELCSCGAILSPRDPFEYRLRHNGTAKYGGCAADADSDGRLISIKICDPSTGRELPPDTVGEICWHGPTVTRGYYNLPEINQAAFTKDGWLKSGDLGVFSEDGYLCYKGRMTDMYKVNGENVSPFFLDSVISQCASVKMVQCVGIPQVKYGEVGVAFLDTSGDSADNHAAIERYCREHLARFQVPKYYFYSDCQTWPRSNGGKFSKKKLRELAEELVISIEEQSDCSDLSGR